MILKVAEKCKSNILLMKFEWRVSHDREQVLLSADFRDCANL